MRTIVFSDSHISSQSNNLEPITKLCNKIIYNKPDLVVMNGDIFDPWKTKWENIIQLPAYTAIDNMSVYRTKHNLKTIYVKGNHDWLVPSYIVPTSIKLNRFDTTIHSYRYIFIHGHQGDIIWGGDGWPGFIHDIAFLIADKAPWLMIPLYNFLFRKKLPSVKKSTISKTVRLLEEQTDQTALDEAMNDWSIHYATIQLRMAKYGFRKKSRIITGHSHCPSAFNGVIMDVGDMLDSFTYGDIQNNNVLLKKL